MSRLNYHYVAISSQNFTFPVVGTIKRSFHPPGEQSRSDKQLLIFDAFERMSGYTYFGIIDHDEFLIPSKDRSLKDLLVSALHV